jgi:hypothetical protein
MARWRGKVAALEMVRGRGVASKRELSSAATVWQCSGTAGGGPVARGAAPKLGEAIGPVHGNGKAVSRVVYGGCSNRK